MTFELTEEEWFDLIGAISEVAQKRRNDANATLSYLRDTIDYEDFEIVAKKVHDRTGDNRLTLLHRKLFKIMSDTEESGNAPGTQTPVVVGGNASPNKPSKSEDRAWGPEVDMSWLHVKNPCPNCKRHSYTSNKECGFCGKEKEAKS